MRGRRNNPAAANMVTDQCGPINHPTITALLWLLAMIVDSHITADPNRHGTDVTIIMTDLEGAYTLLPQRSEDSDLFVTRLTNDHDYLQFAGIFGWTGTPAAFQVVTRVTQFDP